MKKHIQKARVYQLRNVSNNYRAPMKTSLIAIILLMPTNLVAQILDSTITERLNLDYGKRQNDCFNQEGKQNINYCLSVIVSELEGVMKSKLDCILNYFNNEIQIYSLSKKDSE